MASTISGCARRQWPHQALPNSISAGSANASICDRVGSSEEQLSFKASISISHVKMKSLRLGDAVIKPVTVLATDDDDFHLAQQPNQFTAP